MPDVDAKLYAFAINKKLKYFHIYTEEHGLVFISLKVDITPLGENRFFIFIFFLCKMSDCNFQKVPYSIVISITFTMDIFVMELVVVECQIVSLLFIKLNNSVSDHTVRELINNEFVAKITTMNQIVLLALNIAFTVAN